MNKKLIDREKLRNYFQDKQITLAYLLGSQTSEKTKPYSDIDIAILFDKALSDKERFEKRIEMISELCVILETDALDLIDLASASPVLQFEAVKARNELFVCNEKTRVAFETAVLSDYFDRQYYLKRHTMLGMENLRREYGIKT